MRSSDREYVEWVVRNVQAYARTMDGRWLDAIIGILIGVGDLATTLTSTVFFLYQAQKIGMSHSVFAQILWYQWCDFVFGLVPVLGDIIDFFYQANHKCARLFEEYLINLKKSSWIVGDSDNSM